MRGNTTTMVIYVITFLRVLLLVACWLLGGNPSSTLRAFEMCEAYRTIPPSIHARVGVITIEGSIEDSEMYLEQMTAFFANPSISAILLIISSPGGLAGASSAIAEGLFELKEAYPKPVVTWVPEICASGAYLIAAQASDRIIAAPQSTIGGIGVVYQSWRLKKFLKQWGISCDVLHAGTYKSVGNPYVEDDQDGYDYVERVLQDVYRIFIEKVQLGRSQLRGIPYQTWADGKIFIGEMALSMQLIDEVGSHITAQNAIRELADIDGPIEWVHPAKPHAPQEQPGNVFDQRNEGSVYTQVVMQLLKTVQHKPGIRMEYLF